MTILQVQEPVAFVDRLATLTPDQWASIVAAGPDWDAAWDRALELGALTFAQPAMDAARTAGAGIGGAALAGAAAAAVALEDRLGPDDCRALYAPFASIVPYAERRLPVWRHTGAA
jgi:hypothetical protein